MRSVPAAIAFIAVLAYAEPAPAAVVSLWHMDETLGGTMHDSVGSNDGTLQRVKLGNAGFRNRAYRFNGRNSLVTVPSSPSLNPGAAPFSATAYVRLLARPTDDTADIIRKGLSTNASTDWKMELIANSTRTATKVRCHFRGSLAEASAYGLANVADGVWHEIRCIKADDAVSIVVDGKTRTKRVAVGSIANSRPLTIGAKSATEDPVKGVIDEVRFEM